MYYPIPPNPHSIPYFLQRVCQRRTGSPSDVPTHQLDTSVYGDVKSEFAIYFTVAFDESLCSELGTLSLLKVSSLIKVAHHLSDVIGAMAELREFPVDDE